MAASSRDTWTCRRRFCPFSRRDGEHRNHGFCCNACRKGEGWHTSNCGGRDQQITAAHREPEGEPEVHAPATQPKARPWATALPPYKKDLRRLHSDLSLTPPPGPPRYHALPGSPPDYFSGSPLRGLPLDGKEFNHAPPGRKFLLPLARKITLEEFWNEVEDYLEIIEKKMDSAAVESWRNLHQVANQTDRSRQLTIFVLAKGSTYLTPSSSFIDVHDLGVDATPPRDPTGRPIYEMKNVTGVDLKVQAVLATQTRTIDAIITARDMIEQGDLRHFAFVCSHATHRSVGCALMMASFVYHNASIVFSTSRTERAAEAHGMIDIT